MGIEKKKELNSPQKSHAPYFTPFCGLRFKLLRTENDEYGQHQKEANLQSEWQLDFLRTFLTDYKHSSGSKKRGRVMLFKSP